MGFFVVLGLFWGYNWWWKQWREARKEGLMFEEVPLGAKVVVIVNTVINLLLLVPWYFILKLLGLNIQVLGLIVILTNIALGVGIILLKNKARISFIAMQIVSLILAIWPFLCFLTLGLGGAGKFGDDYVPWASIPSALFWQQLSNFILGMMFPTVPMLFSIFCIFYLTRPRIKEQFK